MFTVSVVLVALAPADIPSASLGEEYALTRPLLRFIGHSIPVSKYNPKRLRTICPVAPDARVRHGPRAALARPRNRRRSVLRKLCHTQNHLACIVGRKKTTDELRRVRSQHADTG